MADATTHPRQHRFQWDAILERFYPIGLGIACAIGWLIGGHKLIVFAEAERWHLDQLYVAVFAFLSITTGFLATFYCTIICMSEGFVRAIRDTRVLARFLTFVKRAIVLGFCVSLASIPIMVITPLPQEPLTASAFVVAIWIGAATWAIAAFFRVATLFFFMFEAQIQPRRPAG
jgi:hypothetical protein